MCGELVRVELVAVSLNSVKSKDPLDNRGSFFVCGATRLGSLLVAQGVRFLVLPESGFPDTSGLPPE